MLHINELEFKIGDRELFVDASVHIPEGHRVGVVGRNGIGKSTLFKIIAGKYWVEPDMVRLRPRISIGEVAQEAPDGDATLIDTVLAADSERGELLWEAERASDANRIAAIHERLNDIEAHAAPARAARVLAGLGFTEEEQGRSLSQFSGGWRMRVALASTLFLEPDLLLLDEPTNYLDLEGTLWLEQFIKNYPRTVLLISHDRDILNSSVSHILHVEDLCLTMYRGGYDQFSAERRLRLDHQGAQYKKQMAARKKMEAFVARFRAKATKAKQAQSRIKMLEKMEPVAPLSAASAVTFDFPATTPLASPILKCDHVAVGYDGEPVLEKLTFSLAQDDRIALLGRNGNGKSTLAKLFADRLVPLDGNFTRQSKMKVGYFAQHQVDELDPNRTAFQHMNEKMEGSPQHRVRARLGSFGLTHFNMDIPAAELSGGEKSRLLFALMSFDAPHLMILDEPTNHLDIDAREALIEAINGYEGAVILISHDSHLLSACADELWLVAEGRATRFDGSLEDYKANLLAMDPGKENAPGPEKSGSRKELRQRKAAERTVIAPLRKAREAAERKLSVLNPEMERIEAMLADPGSYDRDDIDIPALTRQSGELSAEIEREEDRWLALEKEIEEAMQGLEDEFGE